MGLHGTTSLSFLILIRISKSVCDYYIFPFKLKYILCIQIITNYFSGIYNTYIHSLCIKTRIRKGTCTNVRLYVAVKSLGMYAVTIELSVFQESKEFLGKINRIAMFIFANINKIFCESW